MGLIVETVDELCGCIYSLRLGSLSADLCGHCRGHIYFLKECMHMYCQIHKCNDNTEHSKCEGSYTCYNAKEYYDIWSI